MMCSGCSRQRGRPRSISPSPRMPYFAMNAAITPWARAAAAGRDRDRQRSRIGGSKEVGGLRLVAQILRGLPQRQVHLGRHVVGQAACDLQRQQRDGRIAGGAGAPPGKALQDAEEGIIAGDDDRHPVGNDHIGKRLRASSSTWRRRVVLPQIALGRDSDAVAATIVHQRRGAGALGSRLLPGAAHPADHGQRKARDTAQVLGLMPERCGARRGSSTSSANACAIARIDRTGDARQGSAGRRRCSAPA